MDEFDWARLTYLLLLLAAVGGWVMVEYRGRLGVALRTALAWGMIFLGVMAGYVLWQDISRDVIPRQAVVEGGEIVLPRAADGHYYLRAEVNGTAVDFLVDTGATGTALPLALAQQAGLELEGTVRSSTAGGVVEGRLARADITLQGGVVAERLRVAVLPRLSSPLLGMDVISRLRLTQSDVVLTLEVPR